MSAERLREASRVLRERAEAASVEAEPPWSMSGQWIESFNGTEIPTSEQNNGNDADEVAVYIATMDPGVGLALADWLDDEALRDSYLPASVRVANLILGDAP